MLYNHDMYQTILVSGNSNPSLSELAKLITNADFDFVATNPDLLQIYPEKGSIKVDQAQALTSWAYKQPFNHSSKLAIVYSADKMNITAQNNLLKTLEEPPASTQIILCAQNTSNILPTIISRSRVEYLQNNSGDKNTELTQLAEKLLLGDFLSKRELVSTFLSQSTDTRGDTRELLEIMLRTATANLKSQCASNLQQDVVKVIKLSLQALNLGTTPKLVLQNLSIVTAEY